MELILCTDGDYLCGTSGSDDRLLRLESFSARYGACAHAHCTGADGVYEYPGGYTDADGCTVLSHEHADHACPIDNEPRDCGEYTCDLHPKPPGKHGDGCTLHAGHKYNEDCDHEERKDCEEGQCSKFGDCTWVNNHDICKCVPHARACGW